jgi:hypothetical protein
LIDPLSKWKYLKEYRQFIFKVTLWKLRITIVAMETKELCSVDIAEACHCQLYAMIFAALLAAEVVYSYLYRQQ